MMEYDCATGTRAGGHEAWHAPGRVTTGVVLASGDVARSGGRMATPTEMEFDLEVPWRCGARPYGPRNR